MMPSYRYDTKEHTKVAILAGIAFALVSLGLVMLPNRHVVSPNTCLISGMASCEAPLMIQTQTGLPVIKEGRVRP